jgi:hypothetical protein
LSCVKNKEAKVQVILSMDEYYYSYNNPFSNSDLKFKLFLNSSCNHAPYFKPIDTLYFDHDNDRTIDTVHFSMQTRLVLNRKINVNEIESLLSSCGINNHKLREHLFWMCELTKAKLIEDKNEFGDITGYYAKHGNNYIPKDYWYLRSGMDFINAEWISLGTYSPFTKDDIKFSLFITSSQNSDYDEITGEGKDFVNINGFKHDAQGNTILDAGGYFGQATQISFADSDISFKPSKDYRIYFRIEIKGKCIITCHMDDDNSLKFDYNRYFFPFNPSATIVYNKK